MNNSKIRHLSASVPVREFLETAVDVEKFLALCRMCPNYGNIWTCPPLAFDPMEIWSRYETLELYARVLYPEPDTSYGDFLDLFRREKTSLTAWVFALEQENPGSLSLAASTCTACSPCRRQQGRPCQNPGALRYSIEALGGDVGKIMKTYLHTPLQWAEAGKLPQYLTVVAGLLK